MRTRRALSVRTGAGPRARSASAPLNRHRPFGLRVSTVMRTDEIETTVLTYLDASSGDLDRALRAAVSDLLDVRDEADLRKLALDQWVSPGYVRGRAIEILDGVIRRRGHEPDPDDTGSTPEPGRSAKSG